MFSTSRAVKLILVLVFASIIASDARPYSDEPELLEEEDYSPDFSELSRRAVRSSNDFPKFPGDYDEYTNDDKEGEDDLVTTTEEYSAPVSGVSDEDVEVPRTEEERVPWYKKVGSWIGKKYKKVKEETPSVLEAGRWWKQQYKNLKGILEGFNEADSD